MKKDVALTIVLVLALSGVVVGFMANGYLSPSNYASNPSQTETPQPSAYEAPVDYLITPTSPPEGALIVPDDYSTINAAVQAASDGQAIYVRAGQYNQSITINKSVWLIGEAGAQIDAHSVAADITINHDNVNVTGFTLRNTPTPSTGSYIEQMQGIGLSIQREDIKIVNAQSCNIYANNLRSSSTSILLMNASENVVSKNNFSDVSGLVIDNSKDNIIQNNFFANIGMAIRLQNGASGNGIFDNTITNSSFAIFLDAVSGNTLRNNTLIRNLRSFSVSGSSPSEYLNTVDSTNRIDGKPIYYLIGESGRTVPQDAGAVVLVNCINMVVQNSTFPLGTAEVTLVNTNNSLVKANSIVLSDAAQLSAAYTPQPPMHIQLLSSFNNNLEKNQANIVLNYSDANTLTANRGEVCLTSSDSNRITENHLTMVHFDVWHTCGIELIASSNNVIKRNNITGNYGAGVSLVSGSSNNIILQNEITKNTPGVMICANPQDRYHPPATSDPTMPSSNVIYGNTFTKNSNQGLLDSGYLTQIISNTMTENSNWGIELMNSHSTSIIGNQINGLAFGVFGNSTQNIQVIANSITVSNNYTQYCLWLVSAYPATFYHNNFYGQVNFSHFADNYQNSIVSDAATCIWDNAGQGNYWSGYSGVDLDGNGVGDTPYPLGFGYYDNYPLIAPFNIASAVPAPPA